MRGKKTLKRDLRPGRRSWWGMAVSCRRSRWGTRSRFRRGMMRISRVSRAIRAMGGKRKWGGRWGCSSWIGIISLSRKKIRGLTNLIKWLASTRKKMYSADSSHQCYLTTLTETTKKKAKEWAALKKTIKKMMVSPLRTKHLTSLIDEFTCFKLYIIFIIHILFL